MATTIKTISSEGRTKRASLRKLCLIFLTSDVFDSTPLIDALKGAFIEVGLDVKIEFVSTGPFGAITTDRLNHLERLVKQHSFDRFVIFHPGLIELFLKDVDFQLQFSAYRNWFDPKRMRVLPYLWTPVGIPENIERLKWPTKPPLRLGFMGTLHNASRLHKFLLNSPRQVRNWLLSGSYLRNARLNAMMNGLRLSTRALNTFVRTETLQTLRSKHGDYPNVDLDIVERQGFAGAEEHMREYREHMEACTYVICPRGVENYSFRMYEALNFGRVPVIIDTDMVLPNEIDWSRLCIRVPYKSLNNIYDYILEDYHSKSEQDFKDRQQAAISTMLELQTSRWVKATVEEILKSPQFSNRSNASLHGDH